jgi:hypothetical protein
MNYILLLYEEINMQIRPYESIRHSYSEEKAFREKNISRSHRDFYIYDEIHTENGSIGVFKNQLVAGVVQVNKLLVRGMPEEEGHYYDRLINERTTFVKAIYIYNIFMNNNIENINERFQKGVLRPIMGIISAYTDTKQLIDISLNDTVIPIDNQFGITVYNFENDSIMSILCNPIAVQDGIIAKVSRLDVPDPRYNIVRYLNQYNSSDSLSIPKHFEGKDLFRKGESTIHCYESYYRYNHSFAEEQLLETSKRIFSNRNKLRLGREEHGLLSFEQARISQTIKLLDRKRALKSLIIDITKASAYSLFESFNMAYETGKKSGFRGIKPPFKQYHVAFMEEKMLFLHTEFIKLCERITEMFGRVRLFLHVNDVEHIVKCIFLDDGLSKDMRLVTLRMTKLECINEYILESMYGRAHNINTFKEDHEIDLLNYYSYLQGDSQYLYEGDKL